MSTLRGRMYEARAHSVGQGMAIATLARTKGGIFVTNVLVTVVVLGPSPHFEPHELIKHSQLDERFTLQAEVGRLHLQLYKLNLRRIHRMVIEINSLILSVLHYLSPGLNNRKEEPS